MPATSANQPDTQAQQPTRGPLAQAILDARADGLDALSDPDVRTGCRLVHAIQAERERLIDEEVTRPDDDFVELVEELVLLVNQWVIRSECHALLLRLSDFCDVVLQVSASKGHHKHALCPSVYFPPAWDQVLHEAIALENPPAPRVQPLESFATLER